MSDENLNQLPHLVPSRTDRDVADDLRAKIMPLLQSVCFHMDVARTHGMRVDIGLNPDAFGRHQPIMTITKAL